MYFGTKPEGFPEKPTVFEWLSQTSMPPSPYVHMTKSIFEPISVLPNANRKAETHGRIIRKSPIVVGEEARAEGLRKAILASLPRL